MQIIDTTYNEAIQGKGYREYKVDTGDGLTTALPVGSGSNTYFLRHMHPGNERIYLEVEFFTSSSPAIANKATGVTGGTVTITGAATDYETYRTIDNGQFEANTWDSEAKAVPAGSGTIRHLRVNFNSIAGDATHAVVTVNRHSL